MSKHIAIITGASGGLGKEFAALMVRENLDEIWCVARSKDKLNAVKSEFGEKIRVLPFDLSKQDSIRLLSELLNAESVNVVYLINNAGIGEKLGSYKEMTVEKSYETIQLNCSAVVALCTVCIPHMQRGSRIINVSSQSSFQPVPYINLYASTKAFVTSFTRALNMELNGTGVTATAVCAGWADTDMLPKTLNGKTVKYPGLVSPKLVAAQGLADAKKGRDMSVCTLYVKYMRLLSKIFPHKTVMRTWIKSVSQYLE
ncbi:SDR family NAD(P)-dependent oxidoreductase [Treponema brennaborense]|uniref:Short-chain dehydrogenase/reductase SDR n=1 Tax=Treponema brennaborense (strain DSM 12168 / CIP 105900 / DD5/3) TaxID=906968 RepID=F4LIU9_TREBD|nr:SDR family NAD(P)-dependent oxidoreductase [Treponema brennaborense]AEE16274.1 short-chain dehydrogenase/reductase SDR [Treponema brennaborense DSM 12168]